MNAKDAAVVLENIRSGIPKQTGTSEANRVIEAGMAAI